MLDTNFTATDSLIALKTLFGFRKKQNQADLESLQIELKNLYQARPVLHDSGRTSLYLGLLALKNLKPDKTEVLVSAYTCNVVVNAILKANLKPIFVDISAKNLNLLAKELNKKISTNTLALISQNTFGILDKAETFQEFCQANQIFFVEDLAHSLGTTNQIYSDFAILSFGSGKIISSSRGGALLTNNKKIHRFVANKTGTLPDTPNSYLKKHLFKIIAFNLFSKFYFYGGKLILALLAKSNAFPKVITEAEKKIDLKKIETLKYPSELAGVLLHQLKILPQNLQHRQIISLIYEKELAKADKIKTFKLNADKNYLMGFPIQIDKPKKLNKNLLKQNFKLNSDWSYTNIVPTDINHKRTQYLLNSCPKAEKIAKHMLYLPTHLHISEKKAYKICTQIIKTI